MTERTPPMPGTLPTDRSTLSYWHLLLVVPFLIFGLYLVYECFHDLAVARREQTVSATIRSHEPRNHSRYGYSFIVAGHTYSGWAIPRDSEAYVVGQQVAAYYDPLDPTTSALRGFRTVALNRFGPAVVVIAGSLSAAALLAIGVLVQAHSSRHSPIRSPVEPVSPSPRTPPHT